MTLSTDEAVAAIERDGYAILERLLSEAEIAELVAALEPFERGRPGGRTDFEGYRTWRVYSMAGKGPIFVRLAEHPRVVELLDRLLLPNWLLSTFQSIRLHPGETRQAFHTDDLFYPIPRPHPIRMGVSLIWAIEAFTADNGATEVIPGSHRWGMEVPSERPHDVVKAIMPAGSVIVFDAALWHRGGDNRSTGTRLALSPQYCQPFLRPQESQLLIVPPDAARPLSDRARAMLGYSIHPPFIGQVEGMHPLRLVDPDYRERKTGDRMVADRVLEKPVPMRVGDDG